MYKSLFVLAIAFLAARAQGATTYQCFNSDSAGFTVQSVGAKVPRVTPFDDATIHFKDEKANWDWMQLISKQEGSLSSQFVYNLMLGGQLIISERVMVGRGGCGRGACDQPSSPKLITAKLVKQDGQESYYKCDKSL